MEEEKEERAPSKKREKGENPICHHLRSGKRRKHIFGSGEEEEEESLGGSLVMMTNEGEEKGKKDLPLTLTLSVVGRL